jgi:hypothetical protein
MAVGWAIRDDSVLLKSAEYVDGCCTIEWSNRKNRQRSRHGSSNDTFASIFNIQESLNTAKSRSHWRQVIPPKWDSSRCNLCLSSQIRLTAAFAWVVHI